MHFRRSTTNSLGFDPGLTLSTTQGASRYVAEGGDSAERPGWRWFCRRLASLSRRPSCYSQSAWSALTFHWPSEIVGCLPSQSAVVLVGADPLQTGDSTRDRRSFCPPLLCLCCGDETSNAQQTSPSRPHIYR